MHAQQQPEVEVVEETKYVSLHFVAIEVYLVDGSDDIFIVYSQENFDAQTWKYYLDSARWISSSFWLCDINFYWCIMFLPD